MLLHANEHGASLAGRVRERRRQKISQAVNRFHAPNLLHRGADAEHRVYTERIKRRKLVT